MKDIKRLGLGCMGMNFSNKKSSFDTIHYALDRGITLLNTGEFYNNGESEMVVGEALQGIPRDKFFISVKFGMLTQPKGGFYGIDVSPWHVKAHLAYTLKRLRLDYIDLYEPARLDEAVPIEELMEALADLKKEGYIRNIGLSMCSEEALKRAVKVHPVHMVELQYSLAKRNIEKGMINTASDVGANILAFGVLAHGLLSENFLAGNHSQAIPLPWLDEEKIVNNRQMIRNLKSIADEENTTVSKLALAWTLAKYPNISSLIGTTSPVHLQESIDALEIELDTEDIKRIEKAFPEDKFYSIDMSNSEYHRGKIIRM